MRNMCNSSGNMCVSSGKPGLWRRSVVVLSVFISVASFMVVHVDSMIIKQNPVRLRVLEYSSKNGSLQKVLNSRYSDLVIGEEVDESSQIVLECSSLMGPLRWIYSGDGQPQHKTYYTSTNAGSVVSYVAYLSFPNGLHAKDTGQYSCQNSYNGSINNYAFLFVPKRNVNGKLPVFVPNGRKHDIAISSGERTVRIPCSVVHPRVNVSIERVSMKKEFWLEPPMRVPFSAKTGFTVPVSSYVREKFICRGEYNGSFEEIMYTTSPQQARLDTEAERIFNFPNRNRQGQNGSHSRRPPTPLIPAPEKHLVSACTPQYCGVNAECIVKDYNPYCVCMEDYTGDAKTGCHRISDMSQHLRVENPCSPTPCGPHSECIEVNGHPLCTCKEGFYGSPPSCQTHKLTNCSKNYDCEWDEFCNTQTRKCESICEGSVKFCGSNSLCTAFSHMPYCSCPPGGIYMGDPYDTEGPGCQLQSEREQLKPSCSPSPCGVNAHCKVYSSYPLPICLCPQGYTGDPSHRCYKVASPPVDVFRPQYNTSITSAQLHRHPTSSVRVCTGSTCGENARCRIRQNTPECTCLRGYRGDPYKTCHRTALSPTALREACSVCGPNSVCSLVAGDVRCICAPDAIGVPPKCKKVTFGAPPTAHQHLSQVQSAYDPHEFNACHSDLDCPQDKVCYTNNKCVNPCSWACDMQTAECSVVNHLPQCSCPIGYRGDPHFECTKIPEPNDYQQQTIPEDHPCLFACGPAAKCRSILMTGQIRSEALSHRQSIQMESDPFQRALLHYINQVNSVKFAGRGKEDEGGLKNPPGILAQCVCLNGFTGNPYSIEGCSRLFSDSTTNGGSSKRGSGPFFDLEQSSSSAIVIEVNPCKHGKNPCGPHSLCVASQGKAFCRCDFDSVGEPPNCMLRCRTDQHCLFDEVCTKNGACVKLKEKQVEHFSELHDNSV